jgi:hypothetical protein
MIDPHYDQQRLLTLIRCQYDFADRTLALVLPERRGAGGVCGHWSVKDLVAHLTGWEAITLRWLAEAEVGIRLTIPEPGFGWDEFDGINERIYQRNRDRSYADILADYYRSHEAILALVSRLSEDELAGGGRMAGMFRDSPAEVIYSNTAHHYDLHLSQIRTWLNGLA